jgi:hypothetical protein
MEVDNNEDDGRLLHLDSFFFTARPLFLSPGF